MAMKGDKDVAVLHDQHHDYRYRIRRYARRNGTFWRWFIFGRDGQPIESGVVVEPDRLKAETAAKKAIERLRGSKDGPQVGWPKLPRGPSGSECSNQGPPPSPYEPTE
jgi:hypothetical protein